MEPTRRSDIVGVFQYPAVRPIAIASLGALVVSLDSAVNIAFPAISHEFGIGPVAIKWVVITYVLTSACGSLASGWLGDRAGHRRVFLAGLWLSALAFALVGPVRSYGLFLVVRVVQGVGSGLVYGSAPALVTLSVPASARGRGLGLLNLGMALGFAVGPAAGGLLVEALGWRWVYLFRVPFALLLAGMALRHRQAREASSSRLPAWAALTPAVLTASFLGLLANLAMFSVWLLAPYYLLDILHQSAGIGGLLFLLTPLGTAVAAPLSGWGADRVGPGTLVVAGLALESAGLFLAGRLDTASHAGQVALALFSVGFGLGIFAVPNMSLVMGALPRAQQGLAGGLVMVARTLGVILGVSLASLVFDWRLRTTASFMTAFQQTLFVSAAVSLAALLASLILVRRRR